MRVRPTAAVALGLAALLACSTFTRSAAAEEAAKPKADAATPVKVDLSTPKKAALSFAQGLDQNDQKAVHAASVGGAEDYAIIDLISGIVVANKELQAAAVAKFGEEEGKKIGQPQ